VGWLHRFSYRTYQVIAQSVQVCLITQLGGEGFQGLSNVALTAVETPLDETLYAASQGAENRRYQNGGSHDCEG
jgi:hypothetical protein